MAQVEVTAWYTEDSTEGAVGRPLMRVFIRMPYHLHGAPALLRLSWNRSSFWAWTVAGPWRR